MLVIKILHGIKVSERCVFEFRERQQKKKAWNPKESLFRALSAEAEEMEQEN